VILYEVFVRVSMYGWLRLDSSVLLRTFMNSVLLRTFMNICVYFCVCVYAYIYKINYTYVCKYVLV